jgi:hypothetical protein
MPLAKSYTRQAEEILDTGKKDVKKIRQAGKFANNEIRDKRYLDLCFEAAFWAGGCKQIRGAHRGSEQSHFHNFYATEIHKSRAQGPGVTRGHVIGCEYE